MKYAIQDLMHAWQEAALALWRLDILDDQRLDGHFVSSGRAAITSIFRSTGWGEFIGNSYVEGPTNPWCGHFQANCGLRVGEFLEPGSKVGVRLDYDLARYVFPSTQRMDHSSQLGRGKWSAAGYTRDRQAGFVAVLEGTEDAPANQRTRERLELACKIPRVATVAARKYGDRRDIVGGHFVLITSLDPHAGTFETIEGNGWGATPNHRWAEGVVIRKGEQARPISELRRVYLFTEDHFEEVGK